MPLSQFMDQFRISRKGKKAFASLTACFAVGLVPLAYVTSQDVQADDVKPDQVNSVEACRIVFGESVPMFLALDKYLVEGGSEDARAAIAQAADEYTAPLDGIAEVPAEVLDLSTNFYEEVSRIPTDDVRNNTASEEEQWDVIAPAGMAQEELVYYCATEGVYLDDDYRLFYDEPLTEEDFVPFGM